MSYTILGVDLAKENSDQSVLSMGFSNTTLDEMKELWSIGEEYPLSNHLRRKYNLKDNDKLIISAIYKLGDDFVYMNMLIKS